MSVGAGKIRGMEATARMPGYPGSTQDGRGIGDHVHQLLHLATALTNAATTATSAATFGSGATDPAAGSSVRENPATVPLGLDLGVFNDAGVVGWAQTLEHLDRFLTGLQVQVAGELASRVRGGRFEADGIKTPVDLLTDALNLGRAESYRRIRLAEHFLPRHDALTTLTTPPTQPVLGAAFFAGNLSQDQALIISTFTEEATHLADAGRIPTTTVVELEQTLTGYARNEAPEHLRRIGLRALNLLDPDGQEPTEGELLTKQGIFFHQPRRGLVGFNGHMSIAQYEMTMVFIGSATNPNPHTNLNDINPNTTTGTGDDGKPTPAGPPPPRPGTSTPGGPGAPLQGQDDLLDLVNHITSSTPDTAPRTAPGAATGTNPGFPPPGFPPPQQGPIPDWALSNGWKPTIARGRDWTPITKAHNPQGNPPTPGNPGTGEASNWPHLIDGINVPAPGSDQDLPGLDTIDPASTDPAVKDRRSHSQKLLDGLIDCLKLAARTHKLPTNGGLKPQLFISTTQTEIHRTTGSGTSAGIALTPYTGPVPLTGFATACCDADITHLLLNNNGDILNIGRTQRRFTTTQRKILIARDMGCTFPDCTAPPYWCDAHHILPWKDGGETNINNGALLCTHHHTLLHHDQWTLRLFHGTPHFTPSYRLDPTRRERHNTYHHGHPKN